MVKRHLKALKSDSFFVFGARGEGKSTSKIIVSDFKYLGQIGTAFNAEKIYVFSNDKTNQKLGAVHFMHWELGLKELFKD